MCVCVFDFLIWVSLSVGGLTCVRWRLRIQWTAGLLWGRCHPPSLSPLGLDGVKEWSPGRRWGVGREGPRGGKGKHPEVPTGHLSSPSPSHRPQASSRPTLGQGLTAAPSPTPSLAAGEWSAPSPCILSPHPILSTFSYLNLQLSRDSQGLVDAVAR